MRPQILALALSIGLSLGSLAAPLSAQANNEYGYEHNAHRGQIMAYLNRSNQIKEEIVQELKSDYSEEELVGLDDTMNSFEVNELLAEIMEAESYQ